jgi:hypothetical protein
MLGDGGGEFLFLWDKVHRLHHRKVFGNAIRSYRKKAGLTQENWPNGRTCATNFIGEVERGQHGVFAHVHNQNARTSRLASISED